MFNNDYSSRWSLFSEIWMIRLKSSLMRQVGSEMDSPLWSVICQIFLCYCPSWEEESAYLLVWFAFVLPIVLPGCSAGLLQLLTPAPYLLFFLTFITWVPPTCNCIYLPLPLLCTYLAEILSGYAITVL